MLKGPFQNMERSLIIYIEVASGLEPNITVFIFCSFNCFNASAQTAAYAPCLLYSSRVNTNSKEAVSCSVIVAAVYSYMRAYLIRSFHLRLVYSQ